MNGSQRMFPKTGDVELNLKTVCICLVGNGSGG